MSTIKHSQISALLVDDDAKLCGLLRDYLEGFGFSLDVAEDASSGLEKAVANEYDVILLDMMLPDMDGFRICTEARQSSNLPIIIMSARTQTSDQLLGYELGADDYVEKPFAMAVMLAKIKAQLRRGYEMQEERNVLKDDDLLVDIERRNVTLKGKQLALSVKEFELLVLLLRKKHTTLRKDYIFS